MNLQCFITFYYKLHLLVQSQILFDTVIKHQTTLKFLKENYWIMLLFTIRIALNYGWIWYTKEKFCLRTNLFCFSFFLRDLKRNCRLFSWQQKSNVTKWSCCKEVIQLVKYLIKNYGSWNLKKKSSSAWLSTTRWTFLSLLALSRVLRSCAIHNSRWLQTWDSPWEQLSPKAWGSWSARTLQPDVWLG